LLPPYSPLVIDLTPTMRELLRHTIDLCHQAGEAILDVYAGGDDMGIKTKLDDSPVTAADLAAHHILEPGLAALLDGVPVLSEEGEIPDAETRHQWQRYWIIDPLDGTKEFIRRSGEFTVNVALIENGVAILGVVYVPVTGVTYSGCRGLGAEKIAQGKRQTINTRSIAAAQQQGAIKVVASRQHGAEEVTQLLEQLDQRLGHTETLNMGSSLKLCLVAEGCADFYPRLAPTCEWDTAAAQAVVEAAGGTVLGPDFKPLLYNQTESLLNPNFYVLGDPNYDWAALLEHTTVKQADS